MSHGEKCKGVRYRLRFVERRREMCSWTYRISRCLSQRVRRELFEILSLCLLSICDHRWVLGLKRFARFLIGSLRDSSHATRLRNDEGTGRFWSLDPATTGLISTPAFHRSPHNSRSQSRLLSVLGL